MAIVTAKVNITKHQIDFNGDYRKTIEERTETPKTREMQVSSTDSDVLLKSVANTTKNIKFSSRNITSLKFYLNESFTYAEIVTEIKKSVVSVLAYVRTDTADNVYAFRSIIDAISDISGIDVEEYIDPNHLNIKAGYDEPDIEQNTKPLLALTEENFANMKEIAASAAAEYGAAAAEIANDIDEDSDKPDDDLEFDVGFDDIEILPPACTIDEPLPSDVCPDNGNIEKLHDEKQNAPAIVGNGQTSEKTILRAETPVLDLPELLCDESSALGTPCNDDDKPQIDSTNIEFMKMSKDFTLRLDAFADKLGINADSDDGGVFSTLLERLKQQTAQIAELQNSAENMKMKNGEALKVIMQLRADVIAKEAKITAMKTNLSLANESQENSLKFVAQARRDMVEIISKSEQHIQDLTAEIKRLSEQSKQEMDKKLETEHRISLTMQSFIDKNKKLDSEIIEYQRLIEETLSAKEELEHKNEILQSDAKKLTDTAVQQINERQSQLDFALKQLSEAREEVAQAHKNEKSALELKNDSEEHIAELHNKVNTLSMKLAASEKETADKQTMLDAAIEEAALLQNKVHKITEQNNTQIEEISEQLEQQKTELSAILNERNALDEERKRLKIENERNSEALVALESENAELKKTISCLNNDAKTAKESAKLAEEDKREAFEMVLSQLSHGKLNAKQTRKLCESIRTLGACDQYHCMTDEMENVDCCKDEYTTAGNELSGIENAKNTSDISEYWSDMSDVVFDDEPEAVLSEEQTASSDNETIVEIKDVPESENGDLSLQPNPSADVLVSNDNKGKKNKGLFSFLFRKKNK